MKVAELILRLRDADREAVVLLLPSYSGFTEAEELGEVVMPAEPWTCERHHGVDGATTDAYHPLADGYTLGWNAATDESWTERVVVLSPQLGNVEARLVGEAGVASDNSALTDSIRQQALEARRRMLADGTLLREDEFRARLGIGKKHFRRMLQDGSVFGLDVDGTVCFPALLTDLRLNGKRLRTICRIIVPAPVGSRFDFLSSPHGALGAKNPLQMLDDDSDYKRLREMAEAWAAQYSRTAVRLYEGEYETEQDGVKPLYTAVTEIDPRRPLWERASEALHSHGYQWPLGPYPEVRTFTLFVERQLAGYKKPVLEACVHILVEDDFVRVRIVFASVPSRESETMPVGKLKTVVDIAKHVIAHLRKR